MTEDELRAMIIQNIARQRSLNNSNNKENKEGVGGGGGIPSITVISGKQPTTFSLDLDTGDIIDNVQKVEVPRADDQLPTTTVETPMVDTNPEPTRFEVPSTTVTDKLIDTVIAPTTEGAMDVPTEMVDAPEEAVAIVTVAPSVVPTKDEPSNVNNTVSGKEESVAKSMVLDTVPVKEETMEKSLANDSVPINEEVTVKSDVKQISVSHQQQQQQQIWSNTLRSIVSTDEEEVLADTSVSNKAVMDVTPLKPPKLVVPIIQTVSPSPEQISKQSNTKLSYLKEEPIPSLDTPDKKDLDPNVKQDLCGCTIM
jgi:hypothetical protein